TGALAVKKGYFEVAQGGTVFIDEVGEVPQGIQPKLLRTLENRVITRVGSTHEIPVDVRIVAATNRSLERAVSDGAFREDLYYRLAVLKIDLPPLRERKGDIPILVAAFIRQIAAEHNRNVRDLTPDALAALEAYPWPGNVRELRNVIESVIVLSMKEVIGLEDLPPHIRQGRPLPLVPAPEMPPVPVANRSLADVEKETILRTLEACGGNRTKAAQILGIGVRTIQRKLAEYGIR
ncbi:MAG: sigma-54-dependent Fis family transcriptional regulator, partial [Planctomycetes bacterium]|nr:sigma-54-dependent Fis family transcriptional regulator [Planctomycetota bacterium]